MDGDGGACCCSPSCCGRRRIVCANFVLADSHLALEQQDLFTANQVIHLKPLIGAEMLDAFLAANPFVARFYPNAQAQRPKPRGSRVASAASSAVKSLLEIVLRLPAPLIEAACRRLYALAPAPPIELVAIARSGAACSRTT